MLLCAIDYSGTLPVEILLLIEKHDDVGVIWVPMDLVLLSVVAIGDSNRCDYGGWAFEFGGGKQSVIFRIFIFMP